MVADDTTPGLRRLPRAARRLMLRRMEARGRRVVLVVTRLIVGGAQRIVLETAAALRDAGARTEIWSGPQTGPEGSLAEEAAGRGLAVRIIPSLVNPVDPVRDLAALRHLVRELRRRRPDLVHTHSSKAGILGRRAARAAGVPRVLHTVHGWGFSERTRWPARPLFIAAERRAAGWADRLIAVSEQVREIGLRHGIGSPGLYSVVRPGIETAPYADAGRLRAEGLRIRERHGIGPGETLIGTVGRLSPQKNPGLLLEAAAATPSTRWLLVGDGPLRPVMEREILSRGLAGRVILAGIQEEAAGHIGALDLFVLPSLWEGLPLTLLEAGAAGVPVVAADVGGVAEAVAPPPAGRLFPPGDLAAFVAAIGAWRETREAARLAAAERREEILRRFTRRRMVEETLSVCFPGREAPAR